MRAHMHSERLTRIETDLAERGVSIAALCRRAEIAQTTWLRWKRGKKPQPRTIRAVEEAFLHLMAEPKVHG